MKECFMYYHWEHTMFYFQENQNIKHMYPQNNRDKGQNSQSFVWKLLCNEPLSREILRQAATGRQEVEHSKPAL